MYTSHNTQRARKARKRKIRNKIHGSQSRPRLSLFFSQKHIYAQLIDDEASQTMIAYSSFSLPTKEETDLKNALQGYQKDASRGIREAFKIGFLLAQEAQELEIKRIVFDRSGYKYHGKVKALATGARLAGLEF